MARDGRGTKKESLSFSSWAAAPRFARFPASPLVRAGTPLTKSEEKERLLPVYAEYCFVLLLQKLLKYPSQVTLSYLKMTPQSAPPSPTKC